LNVSGDSLLGSGVDFFPGVWSFDWTIESGVVGWKTGPCSLEGEVEVTKGHEVREPEVVWVLLPWGVEWSWSWEAEVFDVS
jgi:hypothetical protein